MTKNTIINLIEQIKYRAQEEELDTEEAFNLLLEEVDELYLS